MLQAQERVGSSSPFTEELQLIIMEVAVNDQLEVRDEVIDNTAAFQIRQPELHEDTQVVIHEDTGGYRGSDTRGYIGRDTEGYRRIQEDTGGYRGIQEDTGGYRRIKEDTQVVIKGGYIGRDVGGYRRI